MPPFREFQPVHFTAEAEQLPLSKNVLWMCLSPAFLHSLDPLLPRREVQLINDAAARLRRRGLHGLSVPITSARRLAGEAKPGGRPIRQKPRSPREYRVDIAGS